MKKYISLVMLASSLSVSTMTMAECPASLSADELVDCIVVEGAGSIHAKSEFKQEKPKEQAKAAIKPEAKQKKEQLAQKKK